MPSIVYIDPQSYNNLSRYDCGMLSTMKAEDVVIFCSNLWDCEQPKVDFNPWFIYNRKRNSITKGLSYIKTMMRIIRYIKAHKEIRIVHIQWLRLWEFDWYFLRWLHKKGIKVIFTAHNILPHDSGYKEFNNYKKYYSTVDKICVHTESTKKQLIGQFGILSEKIEIIPHGILNVEISKDKLQRRIIELKEKHGIDGNRLVFSSLGVQSYYKGTDMLIKLWSTTIELAKNGKILLMLVGRNNGLDYSDIALLDNVIIVDERVSNIDFQAYLMLSDVILLPYREISQSGVLFSAVACNKPVVVSDIGGLTDPLKISNIGWNIGKPEEKNLLDILRFLYSNPEIVKATEDNAREFEKVKEYFSWNSISIKLRHLYEDLLSVQ